MTRAVALSVVLPIVIALVACGGSTPGDSGGGGGIIIVEPLAPLVVAAGMTAVAPEPPQTPMPVVDLARLQMDPAALLYELTTPAGDPFAFDILTRAENNSGDVQVSVAHAAQNGAAPTGGPATLTAAGIIVSASSTQARGAWLDAAGDGFARVTISGEIEDDQIIAVETTTPAGKTTALIRVRIGDESPVNRDPVSGTDYPGVLSGQTIYSSDSWRFGLPTIAVSGDRTSIVVYDGDQSEPYAHARYEMRLQHDAQTGLVTGGASEEAGADTGHWRDHETAALFNVLAVVRSGVDAVTLRLSFDRGASFGQTERFALAAAGRTSRLVQIAMAADYTLAVVFWRASATGASELMLVEGQPSAFDTTGSPTHFAFDAPRAIYQDARDVTPVLTGAAYSEGGDLVIGYGFSAFEFIQPVGTEITSEFRCAVRLFGESWNDHLVEQDVVVARDPSVSLIGSGTDLRIFYAYEGRTGARLRTSDTAGATWSAPIGVSDSWSFMPSVHAREQDGKMRVDILFLTWGDTGTELHLRHWDDFDSSASGGGPATNYRLTTSTMQEIPGGGGGGAVPPPGLVFAPPGPPMSITQISWLGYDSTLDGDDIVVVFNEATTDLYEIFVGTDAIALGAPEDAGVGASAPFNPADPPPLAPGLTEPVPAPNPEHMNQLRVMVLD